MKVNIELPAKVEVRDYHDFDDLEEQFRAMNPQIKVIEIGSSNCYIGMVYIGRLADPENKQFCKRLEKECRQ